MNTLLFETIEKIKPIESAFASTHNVDDKYARILRLIFRFKDTPKNDSVYQNLISVVNNFTNNTKWIMATSENSKNYIITPEYFYNNFIKNNESKILNDFDKKMIDQAIEDLPLLIDEIKIKFNLL